MFAEKWQLMLSQAALELHRSKFQRSENVGLLMVLMGALSTDRGKTYIVIVQRVYKMHHSVTATLS